jgi:hypothetical protein
LSPPRSPKKKEKKKEKKKKKKKKKALPFESTTKIDFKRDFWADKSLKIVDFPNPTNNTLALV